MKEFWSTILVGGSTTIGVALALIGAVQVIDAIRRPTPTPQVEACPPRFTHQRYVLDNPGIAVNDHVWVIIDHETGQEFLSSNGHLLRIK